MTTMLTELSAILSNAETCGQGETLDVVQTDILSGQHSTAAASSAPKKPLICMATLFAG